MTLIRDILKVSANLRQSPKQVKNTHSMLTRTLKHLVLEAPEWNDFDEENLGGLSVNFQVANPTLLPMIETLFLKNIYLSTNEDTDEISLARLTN